MDQCEHGKYYYDEQGLKCKWCPKYFRKVNSEGRLVWLGEDSAAKFGGRS